MEFGLSEIEGIKNLLGIDDEEVPQHQFGSALNPSKVGIGAQEKEEIARPNTKIEVKVNNRNPSGGAVGVEERKVVGVKSRERDIWTDEEIVMSELEIRDD